MPIVSQLGYVKDNIHVISNRANQIKGRKTPEELWLFAKWVLSVWPERPTS